MKKTKSKKSVFWNFIKRVVAATWRRVKQIVMQMINNAELVVILVLASIGLTVLLSSLPIVLPLPLWIERTMVIPVIAATVIWGLTKLAPVTARIGSHA